MNWGMHAGGIAKTICSKKRTKTSWNIFIISLLLVYLGVISLLTYGELSDQYIQHTEEYTFFQCNRDILITQTEQIEIEDKNQAIEISNALARVKMGDKITITTSHYSNSVTKIQHSDEILYEIEIDNTLDVILLWLVFLLVGVPLSFMLYGVNSKKQKKWILKFQKQYVLIFHNKKSQ